SPRSSLSHFVVVIHGNHVIPAAFASLTSRSCSSFRCRSWRSSRRFLIACCFANEVLTEVSPHALVFSCSFAFLLDSEKGFPLLVEDLDRLKDVRSRMLLPIQADICGDIGVR